MIELKKVKSNIHLQFLQRLERIGDRSIPMLASTLSLIVHVHIIVKVVTRSVKATSRRLHLKIA